MTMKRIRQSHKETITIPNMRMDYNDFDHSVVS